MYFMVDKEYAVHTYKVALLKAHAEFLDCTFASVDGIGRLTAYINKHVVYNNDYIDVHKLVRRTLDHMPFDKCITLDNGKEELAHATGYEKAVGLNPNGNVIWADEYIGSDGKYYY